VWTVKPGLIGGCGAVPPGALSASARGETVARTAATRAKRKDFFMKVLLFTGAYMRKMSVAPVKLFPISGKDDSNSVNVGKMVINLLGESLRLDVHI
jgi:hypothetical protein